MRLTSYFLIALACATARVATAQIATEKLETAPMPPASESQVFLHDLVLGHIVDGRVKMVDAATGQTVSFFSLGYLGQFTLTPDRQQLLVSAGYFPRLNRGERIDVLEIYDLQSHKKTGEVALPPRRAQALPYRSLLETSADGRWAYVQNAIPGATVTIVDLQTKAVLNEVATPGCWAVYPSATSKRFSTLCGDGKVLTVSLDDAGQIVAQQRSEKLFDVDDDPLFVQAERQGAEVHFVSFKGVLHTLNLDAEKAIEVGRWSLVQASGVKGGWRPGGYMPMALDRSGRLFVAMHPKGTEGTHKNGAAEIWSFDLAKRKLVRRIRGAGEVSLAVTREAQPRLLAVNPEKQTMRVIDAASGHVQRTMARVGDTVTRLEVR